MSRRRRAPEERQAGTTLVELLVTMTVLSLLTVVLVGLTVTVSSAFTRDRAATDSTRIAAVAMNELTRVIRSGSTVKVQNQASNDPVFLVAGPDAVVLRAYIDTDAADPRPVVVRFAVTGTRTLTESRWEAVPTSGPYWTFSGLPAAPYRLAPESWTGPAWTRTIAHTLTPPEASPTSTFRYFAFDGTELVPAADGLTATQIAAVASVTVTLSVQADPGARSAPVVLRNSVGLPNLGISRGGASS